MAYPFVTRALIWIAAAYSGFFVMSVEIIAGRLLAPSFGADVFVWGAVISVFMIGLALGYWFGGLWSTRTPAPAKLGVLILLTGLISIGSVLAAPAVCDYFGAAVADIRAGAFLSSLVLFAAPAMAAGATTPYAIRLIVRNIDSAGLSAGILSFVSTAGSALGVLSTSFILILYFEISLILIVMAIISILLGLILMSTALMPGGKASDATVR